MAAICWNLYAWKFCWKKIHSVARYGLFYKIAQFNHKINSFSLFTSISNSNIDFILSINFNYSLCHSFVIINTNTKANTHHHTTFIIIGYPFCFIVCPFDNWLSWREQVKMKKRQHWPDSIRFKAKIFTLKMMWNVTNIQMY